MYFEKFLGYVDATLNALTDQGLPPLTNSKATCQSNLICCSTILPALRGQGLPSLTNRKANCQSNLIFCSSFVIALIVESSLQDSEEVYFTNFKFPALVNNGIVLIFEFEKGRPKFIE